jgi:hypothetical protein
MWLPQRAAPRKRGAIRGFLRGRDRAWLGALEKSAPFIQAISWSG